MAMFVQVFPREQGNSDFIQKQEERFVQHRQASRSAILDQRKGVPCTPAV
jgi:hypothetical protein